MTSVERVRTTPSVAGTPGGRNAYPVTDASRYTSAVVPVRTWMLRTAKVAVLPA